MNMKLKGALVAILILGAGSVAMADFRFGVRTNDFYMSVGSYDYYPYGVPQGYRPRISFYDVMSDYGSWVYFQPFGRVWRPYADNRWRPYLYGHWTYTQYGPTWQGYEPWAWVGYHYGDWVWTQEFGWVWIPGYDWHAGRVAWSYGADQIGWMPAPPSGYDYYQGSIRYYGNDHYNDSYGYNNGYYGRPDSYNNVNVNLWVFINTDHYRADNYADYCLDRYHTQDLFTRRAVRMSSQPIQRTQLERIVKQRVDEVPVEVRELETDRKSVRVVIPKGEDEHIRKNAPRVVQDVIKPAFEKQNRKFKGQNVQNVKAVERIFKQDPAELKVPARSNENDKVVSRNRDTQFDDHRKQGSDARPAELNSKHQSSENVRRFEEPDRNLDAEKHAAKPAYDNRNPVDDKNRYLGPPQKKTDNAKSFDFQQSTPSRNASREQTIDPRGNNRDVQFDTRPEKGNAASQSVERDNTKDEQVIRDQQVQDDSDNNQKQADAKKNSDKDRKHQKDKKKVNDNKPDKLN